MSNINHYWQLDGWYQLLPVYPRCMLHIDRLANSLFLPFVSKDHYKLGRRYQSISMEGRCQWASIRKKHWSHYPPSNRQSLQTRRYQACNTTGGTQTYIYQEGYGRGWETSYILQTIIHAEIFLHFLFAGSMEVQPNRVDKRNSQYIHIWQGWLCWSFQNHSYTRFGIC